MAGPTFVASAMPCPPRSPAGVATLPVPPPTRGRRSVSASATVTPPTFLSASSTDCSGVPGPSRSFVKEGPSPFVPMIASKPIFWT